MPRYYFHLDNDAYLKDDEGISCSTLDDAKRHAWQVAAELSAHQTEQHNRGLWIAVTDEAGSEVFRLSLAGKTGSNR